MGAVCSKTQPEAAPTAPPAEVQPQPASSATPATEMSASNSTGTKPRVAIVYYSMYGHIAGMAKAVAKGLEAGGAEVKIFQVAETLSQEVLDKMFAPPKDSTVPVINDPAELEAFDGVMFGIPTRFGVMAAQMKAFFDRSGGVWAKGGFIGKTAGVFFSTGTQGGGQETTALTTFTQFVHHGMVIVPLGYSDPALFNMDEVHAGSPYGAGTFAGAKGDRQPSALELGVAESHGKHFATITGALKRGRAVAK